MEKNIITIGTLARLVEVKNIAMLIEAVHLLISGGHQIKLLIGGEGSLKEGLKKMVFDLGLQENITFLGWVNQEEFFKKIDIFILPSTSEAFGIVVLEAFKNKVPVISSNISGPKDIIKHGETGILSEVNKESFAKSVLRLADDKNLREVLAKNAFAEYQKKYSLAASAEKLEKILFEVL